MLTFDIKLTYNHDSGTAPNFQAKYLINELTYNTQGYIGLMPQQSIIYVVFRGSDKYVLLYIS